MFIAAFRKFPDYNFLWKYESNLEIELPTNVMLSPWLNQNDILADSHIKAFISHGGLLSTQEAAWYGIPVIGIPFFVDQAKVKVVFFCFENRYSILFKGLSFNKTSLF